MINILTKTEKDVSFFLLRVLLGIVFFPHGFQKLASLFVGVGISGRIAFLAEELAIPASLAFLSLIIEFIGSLFLISGFFTRIAAFCIACDMIAAVMIVHFQYGFFMNWAGTKQGEGFEYHILAVAIAIALIIKGGGLWSLDGNIYRKRNGTRL